MAKLVRQHGFDFIGRVIVEQGVRKDHPPGVPESSQRRIGFLALFRQVPLIHAAHVRSRTLAQANQAKPQFFIL